MPIIRDEVEEMYNQQVKDMKNFKAKQEEVKELEKAKERNKQ